VKTIMNSQCLAVRGICGLSGETSAAEEVNLFRGVSHGTFEAIYLDCVHCRSL